LTPFLLKRIKTMNETATESRDLKAKQEEEARELREKQAAEARELREKRAAEIQEKREARVAEIQKNKPQPGAEGYYSPPIIEAVVRQPQGIDLPVEEPPPGMSPEEQPATPVTVPLPEGTTASGSGSTTKSGETDYNDYTVAELKDMAHKRGVEVHADMLKDDIIKALKKADKAS
jgi:hypothetical protein